MGSGLGEGLRVFPGLEVAGNTALCKSFSSFPQSSLRAAATGRRGSLGTGGFRVYGLGFGVWSLGFRLFGFRVQFNRYTSW